MMKQTRWHPYRSLRRTVYAVAAIAAVEVAGGGWTRPSLAAGDDAAASAVAPDRLAYMIIAVNGEPHMVKAGGELTVLWGDEVEVREAVLLEAKSRAPMVQVVGLKKHSVLVSPARPLKFTTEQLNAKYSEGHHGEIYGVTAVVGGQLAGSTFVRLTPPSLSFAEVTINGRKLTLRDGEALHVHKQDRFHVDRVVTNLPSNDGIILKTARAAGGGPLSIQLLRGGKVFARLPLTVAD